MTEIGGSHSRRGAGEYFTGQSSNTARPHHCAAASNAVAIVSPQGSRVGACVRGRTLPETAASAQPRTVNHISLSNVCTNDWWGMAAAVPDRPGRATYGLGEATACVLGVPVQSDPVHPRVPARTAPGEPSGQLLGGPDVSGIRETWLIGDAVDAQATRVIAGRPFDARRPDLCVFHPVFRRKGLVPARRCGVRRPGRCRQRRQGRRLRPRQSRRLRLKRVVVVSVDLRRNRVIRRHGRFAVVRSRHRSRRFLRCSRPFQRRHRICGGVSSRGGNRARRGGGSRRIGFGAATGQNRYCSERNHHRARNTPSIESRFHADRLSRVFR
ncbi:hypothetical protein RhoFasK5_03055|nr:hypothetical protein [Rhodococcus kroppenstedtii]